MTVSYNLSVSTSHPWTILKLLFRWRGSVWKYVYVQYIVWLAMFAVVSLTYRFALTEEQQESYNSIAKYLNIGLKKIPMDLILGFFVTAILNRFYTIYKIIGFMDNIALLTSQYVRGTSERARLFRRNIIRFVEMNQTIVFRDLSMRARKRFPTMDTLVAAGIMMQHEKDRFDEIQYRYSKYWLPIQWALATAYNARREGYIESDYYVIILSEEIKQFRTDIAWLCNYDWVPLPLIYPTIVCLLVHVYFLVAVFSRQYLTKTDEIDMYFPFMTSVQFVCYMGWLKVGEEMLNPWGEDDDDFETNMLIDRNLAMGLKMVDDGWGKTPELKKDAFWDHEWTPFYSEQSAPNLDVVQEGSISHVKLPSSVSAVRMVPKGGSNSRLVDCELRSRVVPVKPLFDMPATASTSRRNTFADVVLMAKRGSRRAADTDIGLHKVDSPSGEKTPDEQLSFDGSNPSFLAAARNISRPSSLLDSCEPFSVEEEENDINRLKENPIKTCDF